MTFQPRGMYAFVIPVVLSIVVASGCAGPVPLPSNPSTRPLQAVRRLTIVASGESRFAVVEYSPEPGRTFDQIIKWTPYRWLGPLVELVHDGINALVATDRKTVAGPDLSRISPRALVADELTRQLYASGRFDEILRLDREPVGGPPPRRWAVTPDRASVGPGTCTGWRPGSGLGLCRCAGAIGDARNGCRRVGS